MFCLLATVNFLLPRPVFHYLPYFSLPGSSQTALTFSKSEINVEVRRFPKISPQKRTKKKTLGCTGHFDFIPCMFCTY